MPGGYVHEKVQIGVTAAVTVTTPIGLAVAGVPLEQAAMLWTAAFLGSASSIILTPDLIDIDANTIPEKRIRTVPILGWVVAGIYDVISWQIPHRGISHVPVAGTAITLAVVWPILIPLAWVGVISWQFVLWFFAFKCFADLFHMVEKLWE
jgi:uncharacterized metal-binding protein